jgi:outer membrane lipoprotein-sorting protein
LKEVEASTEDAHAVLEISVEGQGMDEDLVIEVWEKKPDKFRAEVLETSDPEFEEAISVTDGGQVWMYQPSQNEVLVGKIGADEPSSPRDMIQFVDEMIQRVLDTSEVKLVGEETVADLATYKLELTPKEGDETILPAGGKVTLWVDRDRWIVLQAHFSGEVLGEGWMRVRAFELNTGIADDRFHFEIPEGANVISIEDMRPKSLTLDEARAQADFALLVPSYLPEGVTLIEVFTVEGAFIMHYDHSTTSFAVVQGRSQEERQVPIGQETEIAVRGQTATLITDEARGNSFLTWVEDGVTITIAGHIGQDEILRVAESLQ